MSDPIWFGPDDCRLEEFIDVVTNAASDHHYRFAAMLQSGVVINDADELRRMIIDAENRRHVQGEFVHALLHGPGIIVIRDALRCDTVERASAAFESMIVEQRRAGVTSGDHFAVPGANDRVWNALEKLATPSLSASVWGWRNREPGSVQLGEQCCTHSTGAMV